MPDFYTIEAVEKYLLGEMTPEETFQFEQLRQTHLELDQLVVEHRSFLEQMQHVSNRKNLQQNLNSIHQKLLLEEEIVPSIANPSSKLVRLWNTYKKTIAVAASVAAITTLTVGLFIKKVGPNTPTSADIALLDRQIKEAKTKTAKLENDIATVKQETENATPVVNYKTAGSGFSIDPSGLIITNAHVIKNTNRNISVVNTKGISYKAEVVLNDIDRDVAIIKIKDKKFNSFGSLPYGISKKSIDLASPVFTLGFPRDEIVYGQGYISAKTGFEGDTLSYQLSLPSNPGNSGAPVFNKAGEIIGILSAKQTKADGITFAIQSKYIFSIIDNLKSDKKFKNVKLPSKSFLTGLSAEQQVSKIQDHVWMIKVD